MTKEQDFMLRCLRAYFENNKVNTEINIDLNSFYELCNAHNLAPVVFSVIKDNNSLKENKTAYEAFKDAFYDGIVNYDMQKAVIDEIDELLTANEIEHIFFKGAQLKELYPTPELRLMGDIDVLIRLDDRPKAKQLFVGNGFELTEDNGPVYNYHKGDVLVECHTKIVSGKVGNADAETYFEDAINHANFDGFCGELEPEYNLLYLLTHIAHHFWFYGAGVKMILDLAVFIKHFSPDIDRVASKADELNLKCFSQIIFSICYDWFGVGKKYTDDTDSTKEFLLGFGAFGNINRNKAVVVKRKAIEDGHNSDFMTKLALLFPSYKKMKNIPYVKFIDGRPYLLPFCWIYRIIYNFKNKKDFVKEATFDLASDETRAKAQKEFEYFEEIGLL